MNVSPTDHHDGVVVAGIDCGTNSIRLKVARVTEQGMVDIVPKVLRVVRLGEGVDATGQFSAGALERVEAAAREFAAILAEHPVQALRFVATSATRDASNREAFEQMMQKLLGVTPEVISGDEEARLSYLGATGVVAQDTVEYPALVMDLGGGSTELVLGGDGQTTSEHEVQASYSMNIGSVRMTERHHLLDRPSEDDIARAIADIDAHIDEACKHVPVGQARTFVGVSGTVTTMSALALGLPEYDAQRVDGLRMPIDHIVEVNNRFLRMPRAERSTYKAIHPSRVDVVGGGALVLSRVVLKVSEVMRAAGHPCDSLLVSEHGLLDGIVLDLGRRLLRRV